jgi:subtilisin family serine protease
MTMTVRRPKLGAKTRRGLVGGVLLLGAGLASSAFHLAGAHGAWAPLVNNAGSAAVVDQYVVVLQRDASAIAMASVQRVARNAGAAIRFTYGAALHGFSIQAPPAAIDRLRAHPDVGYIEVNSLFTLSTVQLDPPAGVDRTSQRFLPLDHRYTYSHDGTGVHAYVIDTGIRTTHAEFGTRASAAFTTVMDGRGADDCHGHGTHVAGTIGGSTYGIAKNATVHAVRVFDCAGNTTLDQVLGAVDWVTANAMLPAVANLSLEGPRSTALDEAVAESIATGVTYTVAAGNRGADACATSPAAIPGAITVGNIDPTNDTRAFDSNWGTCLDLFAPGESIVSAWWTGDTATHTLRGTSTAAPHVAGAAALYLQDHAGASPADVWTHLRLLANVHPGTTGWAGIVDPGAGSPDVLLHHGALDDGALDDGTLDDTDDLHTAALGDVRRAFQSAGEFVLLRDANGLEIQIRQTPVETRFTPGPDPYTGLASCPSLITAIAARVGERRVTLEPDPHGEPSPDGLQLRIDGVPATLPAAGIALGPGARVAGSPSGGIELDFPDGTTLIATPHSWAARGIWSLDVRVFHSHASEGIIGALAPNSWLPALPGGGSLGPRPASLHQRHLDLHVTFANAWRVTTATSLFDYAPGTSTADFTFPSWPLDHPPCILAAGDHTPPDPIDPAVARDACAVVVDHTRRARCIADVQATGDVGFAEAHQLGERIVDGSTATLLDDARNPTHRTDEARFTATVIRNAAGGPIPAGTVQLVVDGRDSGRALPLDGRGRASWRLTTLEPGAHHIAARYTPTRGTVFLPSTSLTRSHTVR